jgi:hypothetical protein
MVFLLSYGHSLFVYFLTVMFSFFFLKGLGYDGVGRLLGMAHTVGTVLDALPPSRTVLVSSAAKSYQPDVGYQFSFISSFCLGV